MGKGEMQTVEVLESDAMVGYLEVLYRICQLIERNRCLESFDSSFN